MTRAAAVEPLSRRFARERAHTLDGKQGDKMTLVAAYRDMLRVVSAQKGADYKENLRSVVE